ncbi:MAG: glycoside hydrolase family 15 protein [Nocardioidaceae bacterium]
MSRGSDATTPVFPLTVLRDYAMIADGERGVLIGPRGELSWMCVPSWQSPALFSSLIGGAGAYAVTPTDDRFVWGGSYDEGSLIWRSRWTTTTGVIECREALTYPGDRDRAVLLRRVIAVDGVASVDVLLDARADFGRHRARQQRRRDDGVWTARSGPLRLRWTGAEGAAGDSHGALRAVIEVPEGGHHDLVLEISELPLPREPVDADLAWTATEQGWHDAVPDVSGTIADADARHSFAVLRGMTASTGAMVAAATMSLPERAEQGRDYDYRYAWIRDQCYAGQAVAAFGNHALLDESVRFVAACLVRDGKQLRPAYTVDGEDVPHEHRLDLAGYPGGKDIAGNWVRGQFQLDALGEALLLFASAARHDRLDTDHWRAVETAVRVIEECWKQPDAGMWELDNERWAHSRLMCAAGLRAMSTAATPPQAAQWVALADTIVADTNTDCLHPSGRWQRAPDDPRVDASLLLPALRGAVPPTDPRSLATLAAVREELAVDGFVYRFRQDARPLNDAEGAFLFCGFTMALATHQLGRESEAARWFERNRAACGPPGLFTEEYDVVQRQLRGNVPQAFVHALLLESASTLAKPPPPAG